MSRPFIPFSFSLLIAASATVCVSQQVQSATAHRDAEHSLTQTLTGATSDLLTKMQTQRSAISLAVADFDRDGVKDLITGYTLADGSGALTFQRGNRAATAPSGADFDAFVKGNIPTPFLAAATVIALPVRPDIIEAADINGDGALDLVIAQRGDTSAYVLLGTNRGGFLAPQALPLGGTVSSLTAWRNVDASHNVVAGVCAATGCSLNVVGPDGTLKSSFALPAKPTAITLGTYNGGWAEDLTVVSGGSVLLFDGEAAQKGTASMEKLPVADATAVVSGSFVYDRRGYAQMAVLDAAGTVHVLSRSGLDSSYAAITHEQGMAVLHAREAARLSAQREGKTTSRAQVALARGLPWSEVETLSHIAPAAPAESAPVLLRGTLSGGGGDDLAVVSAGKYVTVNHPLFANAAQKITRPAVTIDSTTAPTTAAVLARLSPDPRLGTITADGRPSPTLTLPSSFHKTYTVNSLADAAASNSGANCPATCNLRSAIAAANADYASNSSNVDEILLPSGTLSFNTANYNPAVNSDGDNTFFYPILANVAIVGQGCTTNTAGQITSCSTVINGANLDMIFFMDYTLNSPNNSSPSSGPGPFNVWLSAMELENATNNNNNGVGSGNEENFGGAVVWLGFGGGNLTVNNVWFSNNNVKYGSGGGIAVGSYVGGTIGNLEVDNSTFTGNTAYNGGGAIFDIGADISALLNTDVFSGNTAGTASNSGSGGALSLSDSGTSITVTPSFFQVLNSTFTSNTAVGSGSLTSAAGAAYLDTGFTITGSTFTGNAANHFAGALDLFPQITGDTITDSSFSTNTASSTTGSYAGAVYVISTLSSSSTALSVQYSRFAGNIAKTNTALEILSNGGTGGVVSATNDWWGCNPTTATTSITGSQTAGNTCDTAGSSGSGVSFSGSPFTQFQFTSAPTTVAEGGTYTATAGAAQNSSGTTYSGNQDNDLSAVAASLTVTQKDGTTTTTDTPASSLTSSDTISGSATIDSSSSNVGSASVSATLDGQTISSNFTIYGPPSSALAFSSSPVTAGSNVTLTMTVTNPNSSLTLAGLAFTNTLPSNLTYKSTTSNSCGGTLSTASGSVGLSGGSVSSGSSCTVVVVVSSTVTGTYSDSFSTSSTTSSLGSGNTATAGLTVNPAGAATFTVTGLGPFAAPGLAGTATVTAKDNYGNVATGYTGTVHFSSSDTLATLPANYTFVSANQGVKNFSVTPNTASGTVGATSVTVTDTASSFSGSETGIFVGDSIWLVNANSTDARLTNVGVQTSSSGSSTGSSTRGFVAFDTSGNAWMVANAVSEVQVYSRANAIASTVTSGGVNNPVGVAIDGLGNAWVANGNNTLTEINSSFVALSPSAGYQSGTGKLSGPTGIALDNAGAVWVVNGTGNSVTKVFGGAAPAPVPLVSGSNNVTLGARP